MYVNWVPHGGVYTVATKINITRDGRSQVYSCLDHFVHWLHHKYIDKAFAVLNLHILKRYGLLAINSQLP